MRLLPAGALVIALLAQSSPAAAATNWYVDGTTGNDANTCTAPGAGNACFTIQAAINKAFPGDTIHVAAATYPEPAIGPLSVNKTLTILGAQAGVDARGRVASESIVTDFQGTFVTASNVIVDGFTLKDSVLSAFTGYGIAMGAGTTGTRILNNIIEDNIAGIALANTGVTQVLIRHNLIQNNNLPGGASGSGIYTDEFVAGGAASNFLIDENKFVGNADAGIDVSHSSSNVSNLDVSNNVFDMNGRAIFLINTDQSSFHGNTVSDSTFASADVRIFGGVDDFTILNNNLSRGPGHAIRLTATIGGPNSGVVIHQNNIEVYALTGLTVEPLSHVGTVNAECNWWNSSSGPFNAPNNLTGTGEEVVGDADFTPWLTAPAPGGSCFGGQPSTPGKVTGGGQIPGDDPLFSPTGDLLSLPALTISSANSNGKATFGFSVRCCPEKGNLEYNDHDADVRIKAQTVDHLTITNGSAACPMIPGAKHAQFTGLASVIRSSQTTTERYVVDVDDCGEPGTNDTFGIHTTPLTYSNGPSQLIGGNIQIH